MDMLKKLTTTKQDQTIEAEARAQFAKDVIGLYRARLAGQPEKHPDPEVRAVAFGLVALKQAIAPVLHRHRDDPEALVYTGVKMADGIIDALTTGRGPLWKLIGALQTEVYRPSAAPGAHEMQRREIYAGLVLAYQEAACVDQAKAARAVAEGVKMQDFPISPGQLKKWVERNGEAARNYADRFLAADVDSPADHYSETERVLRAGRKALFPLVVPS
jgi:hypothetical protein